MHKWEWHEFIDDTEQPELDEDFPFSLDNDLNVSDYIIRNFLVGDSTNGQGLVYTIGFSRITKLSVLKSIIGEVMHDGDEVGLPESGAWIVTFDLAEEGNGYDHVELTLKAKKDLVNEITNAVYDHYNVSKSGLYCWYAQRDGLAVMYDRALGFSEKSVIDKRVIPLTVKFNQLNDHRRGYAIITKYY